MLINERLNSFLNALVEVKHQKMDPEEIHELARFGSEVDFAKFAEGLEEYTASLYANRKNDLRYTPLHSAIFAR